MKLLSLHLEQASTLEKTQLQLELETSRKEAFELGRLTHSYRNNLVAKESLKYAHPFLSGDNHILKQIWSFSELSDLAKLYSLNKEFNFCMNTNSSFLLPSLKRLEIRGRTESSREEQEAERVEEVK